MSDFSPKLPIWYQLAATLRGDILSGRLPAGTRIEPELRLAERHGVSVMPVRQALKALGQEQLIVRRPRSGTYVSERVRAADGATSLQSLYSREFGRPAKVLDRGIVPTPAHLACHFADLPALAYVRRLAYRDDRAWSYGTLYFPANLAARITTPMLRRWPLYRIMRERCGVAVVRSHFDARAVAAAAEVADALDIDPLSPVLSLACVSFDADERAIGAFDMSFPSAPFVFSFDTIHEQA